MQFTLRFIFISLYLSIKGNGSTKLLIWLLERLELNALLLFPSVSVQLSAPKSKGNSRSCVCVCSVSFECIRAMNDEHVAKCVKRSRLKVFFALAAFWRAPVRQYRNNTQPHTAMKKPDNLFLRSFVPSYEANLWCGTWYLTPKRVSWPNISPQIDYVFWLRYCVCAQVQFTVDYDFPPLAIWLVTVCFFSLLFRLEDEFITASHRYHCCIQIECIG